MDDADTIFMSRALELAGRGAGFVSPNPMVGAVIVNNGKVVGEGFHRYDRLRHAESYALELAGQLARGATLYCNLEPCCHHGRTPPCTDSVIEAGIRRAVIATVDPDSRVNGRGIELLRAAGISVEVGLGQQEALMLNEAYLKYVTSGMPFLHAVIVSQKQRAEGDLVWTPSSDFLRAACESDVIALGISDALNRSVIESALGRERHRKLAIAGSAGDIENLRRAFPVNGAPTLIISPTTNEISYASDSDSFQVTSPDRLSASAQFISNFTPVINRLGIRSILALPGSLGIRASVIASQADKVTIITRRATGAIQEGTDLAENEFDLNLEHIETRTADGFNEITGYPRREAAKVS